MPTESAFVIREHIFDGQHIREYPGALAHNHEDVVRLHAKSYTPKEVATGRVQGELTIVAFHANAFNKELYEPFLEQLYQILKTRHGLVIGSIWFADQANQGDSALLNDSVIGNDSSWFDHSRDVLQMVNTFRSEMKRPIIGLGHSMGASQAVAVATYHPRVFEALVLIDPAMTMTTGETIPAMIKYALSKPETFKSYEAAEKYVHKHPFFKRWHPAAKQKYIETAFHIESTTLYPERDGTLKPKTSVFAETRGITRPNLQHAHVAKPPTTLQRYSIPDVDTSSPYTGPGYNPFSRQAYAWLGQLRPATQFILGKGSKVNPVSELEERTNFTGSRVGGSGGVKAGNVKSVTISGGHFLPMTNPEQTAEEAASWMADRIEKWRLAEKQFSRSFDQRDRAEKQALEPEVAKTFKNWDGKLWDNPHAERDGGKSRL